MSELRVLRAPASIADGHPVDLGAFPGWATRCSPLGRVAAARLTARDAVGPPDDTPWPSVTEGRLRNRTGVSDPDSPGRPGDQDVSAVTAGRAPFRHDRMPRSWALSRSG
jgi:hypothetical protein